MIYFHYFLNQLERIRTSCGKDFRTYIQKLSVDGINLAGEKFEILTYARLLEKNISFSKPASNPDFKVELDGKIVFIECGIKQANKPGFFVQAIEDTIYGKQRKGMEQGYANRDTALHIDISKTMYNSFGEPDFLDESILNDVVDKSISNVSFGAIVLVNTFYAQEDGIVYSHPIIRYTVDCNPDIEIMHGKMFNLETKKVTPILREFI